MKSFTYAITLKLGLHARPCAMLAQKVNEIDSKVTVAFDGRESDCSSMPSLLNLKVKKDSIVTVTVEGANEEADAAYLEKIFKENF